MAKSSKSAKPAGKKFDAAAKAAWLANKASKASKIDAAKEMLEAGLGALQTSAEWKAMLTSIATNARRRLSVSRYSFRNQILVAMQKPCATSVAGFQAWKGVGRNVKKGEKGIAILSPRIFRKEHTLASGEVKEVGGIYFQTVYVFDVSQTEGADLPEPPALKLDIDDDAAFHAYQEKIADVALAIEVQAGQATKPVSSMVFKTSAELRAEGAMSCPGALGWYSQSTRGIVIVADHNRTTQFHTACHEVAHALLHPVGNAHSSPEREVEAESVAYIVCHALGLDSGNMSFPYVATWAQRASGGSSATKMVQESGARIVKAAHIILDALLGDADADADVSDVEMQSAAE